MRFVISCGDDVHQVEVVSRNGDALSMRVDGVSYALTVAGPVYAPPSRSSADGPNFSPAPAPPTGEQPSPAIPDGHITAPMPGLIAEVKAVPGTPVQPGAVLVVIEAMKMENNITAPVAGVVRAVPIMKGQEVQRGQLLVVVDPA